MKIKSFRKIIIRLKNYNSVVKFNLIRYLQLNHKNKVKKCLNLNISFPKLNITLIFEVNCLI